MMGEKIVLMIILMVLAIVVLVFGVIYLNKLRRKIRLRVYIMELCDRLDNSVLILHGPGDAKSKAERFISVATVIVDRIIETQKQLGDDYSDAESLLKKYDEILAKWNMDEN